MAADWEEVKRLAADFQRAQLSSTVQRLSDRNCVEIVKKLLELKLIEVIFTNDGKEYITPRHLQKEILDELTVAGGRINLVDLAHNLNVDLNHIETKTTELVKSDSSLQLVLGQLVDRSYLDFLAEEINEKLQQAGQITIGEITKQYDLPPDFLEEAITSRIGTIIHGQTDPFDKSNIFTESFIAQHRYRIRGALSAVTRPTQIATLISAYCFPDRLCYGMIEDLIKAGRLAGSLSGGRSERASYIPEVYSKSQNNWVDTCYRQNGYLEYDALSRLNIQDPKGYIKKRFKTDQLVFLNTVCVGQTIMSQVEAAIEDVVSSSGWSDIMSLLPSVFNTKDCQSIIQSVLKGRPKSSKPVQVLCETIVVSEDLVNECQKSFDPLMTAKAELDAQKGVVLFESMAQVSSQKASSPKLEESKIPQDKREERRKKAAGGKSGGGTQGRETKTKSVKKKHKGTKGRHEESDSDDEGQISLQKQKKHQELEFMTMKEVQDQLEQLAIMGDCPKALSQSIAENLHRTLTRKYQEVAKSVFLASAAASGANRRKTHAELQEKLTSILSNIHQYDKGLKILPDDLQTQLNKHLLKTLCSDIANMVVNYLVLEQGIATESDISANMAPEVRQKFISKLSVDVKEPLQKLHNSLNSKTTEDFLSQIEVVLGPGICDMIIRIDKKKERQILHSNKQSLLSQLKEAVEPALCLHVAILLLFQTQTQKMVYASGKFVPQLITYLRGNIPDDVFYLFHQVQELVVKLLSLEELSEEKNEMKSKLEQLIPKLKEVTSSYRRSSISEEATA